MNDEMVMKRRGGTKSKTVVERMLNVFDLHFPTPAVEEMSRVCAKLREICKYLAGACNSNSHARGLHYLTFVCKTKQGNHRNEASRLRECIKKRAQRYQFAWNAKMSLCKLNSIHCRHKTTTSL
jgi:hypothetical protein